MSTTAQGAIAATHHKLKETNHALQLANERLNEMNQSLNEMNQLNGGVILSTRVTRWRKYILVDSAPLCHLCRQDRDHKKRVVKLVKAKRTQQVGAEQMAGGALNGRVCMSISIPPSWKLFPFPDFVEEFNALKPEERIVLEDDSHLSTTLRIFAPYPSGHRGQFQDCRVPSLFCEHYL